MTEATGQARKLGLKPGSRLALVGAPSGWELSDPPSGLVEVDGSEAADVIVAFFEAAAAIEAGIPALAERIFPAGALWCAWPRRAGGHTSDITTLCFARSCCGTGSSTRRSQRSTPTGPGSSSSGGATRVTEARSRWESNAGRRPRQRSTLVGYGYFACLTRHFHSARIYRAPRKVTRLFSIPQCPKPRTTWKVMVFVNFNPLVLPTEVALAAARC
jgi:hypothetical protein